ncbi:hypothetical protein GF312_22765 [Candidatus Poribacteria bacterium]|nr:hypothetical protein [Candidatus Poribacteria bacterium]
MFKSKYTTGFLLCLLVLFYAIPVLSDVSDLVILHINDTHGRLRPYNDDKGNSIGGIARVATLIDQIKKENKGKTLVLHAGDLFSRGDDLTVHYGGGVNLKALQAAGYEVMVPGNGEFYFGPENLVKQASQVTMPVILANVVYKNNDKILFKPYIIKEVNGIKIAILGLGFIRLSHPSARNLELKDHVTVAKEYIPELKKQSDIIIALTHIGLNEDKRLAREVPEIDIIVGGHSHSRLETPLEIERPEGNGSVVVAQAWDYRKKLGRLNVSVNQDGIKNVEGKLIPINGEIPEDKDINAILDKYSQPLSEVICTSEVSLPNPKEGKSPMGNLVVKAVQTTAGTEAAFLDRGAVQSGIEPGDITLAQVSKIHPWRNRIVKIKLTGKQIRKIMEKHDLLMSNITSVDGDKVYEIAAGEFVLASVPSIRNIDFDDTGERVDSAIFKYLKEIKHLKAN